MVNDHVMRGWFRTKRNLVSAEIVLRMQNDTGSLIAD